MRTIVDIPDAQVHELDRVCKRRCVSRAALVREAVGALLEKETRATANAAFGVWRQKPIDALAFQCELREEWDR